MSSLPAAAPPPGPTLGRHPGGLFVLFFAEMWERFSYYGMRALLVLYLTKRVGLSDADAGLIYGTYTGLVYLTPLIGGYLADRFLGQRKAILIGGAVMAMGHFAMAFEPLLYLALTLLVIGNGFFKPNISTMVGNLYGQDDPRRDGGYTVFYMGINVGAFLAPLACGTLGEYLGWHYGFGAAGVGMVVGLLSFFFFQGTLVGGFPPARAGDSRRLRPADYLHVALISALCLGIAMAMLEIWPHLRPLWRPKGWGDSVLMAYHTSLAVVAIGFLILRAARPRASAGAAASDEESAALTRIQWQRVSVIFVATLFATIFWAAFEQAGNTLTLFADRHTDRHLLGIEFPASYFQAVNPLLIVLLAPFFTALWTWLGRTQYNISATAKLGIGLLWVGLGYVVMYFAAQRSLQYDRVGPHWLAIVYLTHTIGELCLSPIGLSLVNRLSPARLASIMMAVWFLAPALGSYLGGTLHAILETYGINLWIFLVFIPIGSGLLMLALNPVWRRLSHGRD